VIVNIPGQYLSAGTTVSEYAPPNPPTGTGEHRYIFLLFRQVEAINPVFDE
jgi:phosphatidylethanolamine-binding protein (PEBP) family uncharacterized protein